MSHAITIIPCLSEVQTIWVSVFHLAIQLAVHSVSTLKVLNLMDGCRLDRMWASLLRKRRKGHLAQPPSAFPSVLIAGYTPHRPLIGLIWRAASQTGQ